LITIFTKASDPPVSASSTFPLMACGWALRSIGNKLPKTKSNIRGCDFRLIFANPFVNIRIMGRTGLNNEQGTRNKE